MQTAGNMCNTTRTGGEWEWVLHGITVRMQLGLMWKRGRQKIKRCVRTVMF